VPLEFFGGYLIRPAFELAVIHAEQIAPHRPLVVCINRINFLQPVPKVYPTTYAEDARYLEAYRRRLRYREHDRGRTLVRAGITG
jgi:hypothetical protein